IGRGLGGESGENSAVAGYIKNKTYDKVVFDDLKANATINEMIADIASHDTGHVTPIKPDLFFQAEDGIRDSSVTGVQTFALPIFHPQEAPRAAPGPCRHVVRRLQFARL